MTAMADRVARGAGLARAPRHRRDRDGMRPAMASSRPRRSACRWATSSSWPSARPRPRRSPRRCGTPAGTRPGCSRRSSTSRRASRRRRWIAGRATSTTGASATRCASICSIARRTPGAKVEQWSGRRDEFVKRAAFALLGGLALHDKARRRRAVPRALPLIERAAADERNFVKKGVSWALRGGGAAEPALHTSAAGAGAPAGGVGGAGGAVGRQGRAARAHQPEGEGAARGSGRGAGRAGAR